MKCGVAVVALNSLDWERVNAEDWTRPPVVPDHEIWDNAIRIGDLAEPLGFDSIWSAEHFATPYGLTPNALQHLAFWAGRTERVDLGSLVVVVPWHHPVQLAGEIAMLDILLQGRTYNIGFGRGLSSKEYDPLNIPQDEARQRFDEAVEIVRLALTTERFSYDGKIFTIPETSLRPQPRNKNIFNGAMGAFMTSSSLEAIAKSGLGHIVVAQQSFEQVGRDTALFNQFRQEAGLEPNSQPTMYLFAYCTEREEDTELGRQYVVGVGTDGAHHYGFAEPEKFKNIKGYEQYADMFSAGALAARAEAPTDERFATTLIGTPDQIIKRIEQMQELTSADNIAVAFHFHGTMPIDDAERSMRLFAKEVLPAVQEMPTPLREVAVPASS